MAEPTNLTEALMQFRDLCPEIVKDQTARVEGRGGRSFEYSFASLDGILKTVKPVLKMQGLSYRWNSRPGAVLNFSRSENNGATVVTSQRQNIEVGFILTHKSGESIETWVTGPADEGGKSAPQAVGSALTYYQRYALCLALGLSTIEDTDGGEKESEKAKPQETKQKQDTRPFPTNEQMEKILAAPDIDPGLINKHFKLTPGMIVALEREIKRRNESKSTQPPPWE